MTQSILRIATRESPLALWQAEQVAATLRTAHRGLQIELVPMTTRGDVLLDSPLAAIGGKGLFIKELERAIYDRRADIAAHSMKDVPAELPPGLMIGALAPRHTPNDALVSNRYQRLAELPDGARVGTCSLRRQAQLLSANPSLTVLPLRGNVNTRLAKLDAGDYDAIVLAAAGLERLGLHERIAERLDLDANLPALGQGIMGVECRADDTEVIEILSAIDNPQSNIYLAAERAFGRQLAATCHLPLAGFAELVDDNTLRLRGLVAQPDGTRVVRGEITGSAERAEQLGVELAERLLGQGAAEILAALGAGPPSAGD